MNNSQNHNADSDDENEINARARLAHQIEINARLVNNRAALLRAELNRGETPATMTDKLRKAGYVEPVLPPSEGECRLNIEPESQKKKSNPWSLIVAVYIMIGMFALFVLSLFALPILLALKLAKAVL